MIYNDIPIEVLGSIKPQYIRLYLASRGWNDERSTPTGNVFRNESLNEEVIVPNSNTYRDYQYRVEDLVNILSSIEKVPHSTIITGMMLSTATDIVEYKYEPQNKEVGLIPIQRMIDILNANWDLTNNAYRDLKEWKSTYPSSRWAGQKILDDIRVGPTIPGSYIIKFIYPAITGPVQSNLDQNPIYSNEDLKLVCDKLESSLRSVINSAERNRNTIDQEEEKISYNFVSSIMDLKFDDADVEIKRQVIVGKESKHPNPIALTTRIFNNISKIERSLRPSNIDEDLTFAGYFIEMKDERQTKDENIPGTLRLRFINPGDKEGRALTAKLSFSGDELNFAYSAMKERKPVTLKGKLIGTGRSKHIEDVYDFKVNE